MNSVTVLGAGSWGTALALVLDRKGERVSLWDRKSDSISKIKSSHQNERYLPGFELGDNISPSDDLTSAMTGSDFVIIAVPSHAVRPLLQAVSETRKSSVSYHLPIWIMAAKGLEPETGKRMSEVAGDMLTPQESATLVTLSGPNLAIELAKGISTATVAASNDENAAKAVQNLFMTPCLRVYTNNDVAGVELGGALKNVFAIAAGITDALGYGDNTKGALLARGLTEMTRLGKALGAKPETFLGLTGVGDLFATAASTLSRNYRLGFALGLGKSLEVALEELGQVAEGVPTAHAALILASRHAVELPLFEAIEAVLSGKLAPENAVPALMSRAPKEEI